MSSAYTTILWAVMSAIVTAACAQSTDPTPSSNPQGHFIPSQALNQASAKASKSLQEQGFIEKLTTPPRAEYVLKQMAQRRLQLKQNGIAETPAALGFYKVGSDEPVPVQNSTIKKPPAGIVSEGSENYIFPGGHPIKQLYTRTIFGTLIIDQKPSTQLQLEAPNLSIADHPATLIYVKHQDDQWATIIYATDGDTTFVIEANQRLEGSQKQNFIKFADQLITS